MKQYTAGLQLHTSEPEYIIQVTGKDSDEAWQKAEKIYRQEYGFNTQDLITLVLWDEKNLH